MRFKKLGALTLAAALMATSTAIVAEASVSVDDEGHIVIEKGSEDFAGKDNFVIKYSSDEDTELTIGFAISPDWSWHEYKVKAPAGEDAEVSVAIADILAAYGVNDISVLGGGKVYDANGKPTKLTSGEATTGAAAETAAPAEPAEEVAEETTVVEEDDDEAPAEAEWVGVTSGGTAAINKWISFDKLGGAKNKPCLLLCSEDDKAEPPADSELSFKVSDIYGFVFYAEFDKTAWENWHGGQIGTNSALGGWNAFIDYSTGNEVDGLDIDIDAGTITYLGDKPLFAQDEQDKGGYAHIWLMDWSNGDDAVKVCGMDILDENGDVITFDAPEEEEDEPVQETAGDVDAATDSSKGSPDTGVADVAAVAGLGVLAAGAFIAAKKRK